MFIPNFLLPLALSAFAAGALIPDTSQPSDKSLPLNTTLPTVDLGYGVYRATYYNESYDAYVFSNVRFARPPTGALRFGPPQPPLVDRSKIHDGSEGFICHAALANSPILPPVYDAPQSEDCLFLDLIVPRTVLNGDVGKVPVLFWIFGGAYTMGSKNTMGDPITFLKHSPSPVVYVGINYRVGHFGFLGGPSLTLAAGTIPNAGLHDQLFGLQWVQDNVHLFNGDKDEVTVMGMSAGGGSALHHVTAYGGLGPPPMFKRVLPMSAGFAQHGGHSFVEDQFKEFEAAVGCAGKGVECIRAAPEETLIKANKDIITALVFPRTGPSLSVDGNYVPDLPQYLLSQGRFHKNITVLTTSDSDEGKVFVDPNSPLTAEQAIDDFFPTLSPATRSTLLSFYPPPSNSTPYTTEVARFAKIIADYQFNNNRYAVSAALPDRAYNLVDAGLHGTGANLVFNDLPSSETGYSEEIVNQMRRFVMNFVVTGNPNEAGGGGVSPGVEWPLYGAAGRGLNIDGQTVKVVDTTEMDVLLKWWAQGPLLN